MIYRELNPEEPARINELVQRRIEQGGPGLDYWLTIKQLIAMKIQALLEYA